MTEQIFFNWFAITWVILAAIIFVVLFFITAPYGKFTRGGWGPSVNRTAGWVIMESPAVLTMILFFVLGNRQVNPVAIAFLILWQIHYLQRTFVFPFRMRGDKKGITLVTVLLGVIFNVGNGYLNGRYLFTLSSPYTVSWFGSPFFIVGVLLFFIGLGINIHSDAVLRSLRKPGETGYQVPQKGMFRYVSAGNYFGEIIEWTGWAVATWSISGFVFLIWTAANLVPRAKSQLKWYRATFPDYPKERKAILPFVY